MIAGSGGGHHSAYAPDRSRTPQSNASSYYSKKSRTTSSPNTPQLRSVHSMSPASQKTSAKAHNDTNQVKLDRHGNVRVSLREKERQRRGNSNNPVAAINTTNNGSNSSSFLDTSFNSQKSRSPLRNKPLHDDSLDESKRPSSLLPASLSLPPPVTRNRRYTNEMNNLMDKTSFEMDNSNLLPRRIPPPPPHLEEINRELENKRRLEEMERRTTRPPPPFPPPHLMMGGNSFKSANQFQQFDPRPGPFSDRREFVHQNRFFVPTHLRNQRNQFNNRPSMDSSTTGLGANKNQSMIETTPATRNEGKAVAKSIEPDKKNAVPRTTEEMSPISNSSLFEEETGKPSATFAGAGDDEEDEREPGEITETNEESDLVESKRMKKKAVAVVGEHFSDWSDAEEYELLGKKDILDQIHKPQSFNSRHSDRMYEQSEQLETISDDEFDANLACVDDLDSKDQQQLSGKQVLDILEIDWASLVESREPEHFDPGSARKRFSPANIFAEIGISQRHAGVELTDRIRKLCQTQSCRPFTDFRHPVAFLHYAFYKGQHSSDQQPQSNQILSSICEQDLKHKSLLSMGRSRPLSYASLILQTQQAIEKYRSIDSTKETKIDQSKAASVTASERMTTTA